MNIHEYQAKELLKTYGVVVPRGVVVETADQAEAAANELVLADGRADAPITFTSVSDINGTVGPEDVCAVALGLGLGREGGECEELAAEALCRVIHGNRRAQCNVSLPGRVFRTGKRNVTPRSYAVNNFAAKKRPCGPVLAGCGIAYLLFLVLLLGFGGY